MVKTEGKKRRRTVDPVDREAKARERTLRNRAAAQLSREKKRRYVEELETTNTQLKRDNVSLAGRLSGVEADNRQLTHKLEEMTLQLNAVQSQMSFLASLAACRNSAATAAALPLAQSPPSPPRSLSTPMLQRRRKRYRLGRASRRSPEPKWRVPC
jgi:small-conductance mechanosensitive channel